MSLIARGALAGLLVAALPASAQDAPKDKPHPIALAVGAAAKLCATGTIVCPSPSAVCDDPSVATTRFGPDGVEIVGVKPGKTLCSATSANYMRQVYAVTVR